MLQAHLANSANRAILAALLGRRKTGEQKAVGWKPGTRQRGYHCRRSRNADNAVACGCGLADELEARIGNERRACIADESDRPAIGELSQDARQLSLFVMLVIGSESARNSVLRQKLTAVAGVLAVDDVAPRKDTDGPQCEIGQVADWSGDEIEPRCERLLQCLLQARHDLAAQSFDFGCLSLLLANLPIFRQAVAPWCSFRQVLGCRSVATPVVNGAVRRTRRNQRRYCRLECSVTAALRQTCPGRQAIGG